MKYAVDFSKDIREKSLRMDGRAIAIIQSKLALSPRSRAINKVNAL